MGSYCTSKSHKFGKENFGSLTYNIAYLNRFSLDFKSLISEFKLVHAFVKIKEILK